MSQIEEGRSVMNGWTSREARGWMVEEKKEEEEVKGKGEVR